MAYTGFGQVIVIHFAMYIFYIKFSILHFFVLFIFKVKVVPSSDYVILDTGVVLHEPHT